MVEQAVMTEFSPGECRVLAEAIKVARAEREWRDVLFDRPGWSPEELEAEAELLEKCREGGAG